MAAVPNRWQKKVSLQRMPPWCNSRKLSIIRAQWPLSLKRPLLQPPISTKPTKAAFLRRSWVWGTQMQARGRKQHRVSIFWAVVHPHPTHRKCARYQITPRLPTKSQTHPSNRRPTWPTLWPLPPKTCRTRTIEAQSRDSCKPSANPISTQCPDVVAVAFL